MLFVDLIFSLNGCQLYSRRVLVLMMSLEVWSGMRLAWLTVNKNTGIHCFSNGGVLLNLAMCDVLDRIRLFLGHLAMAFGCVLFGYSCAPCTYSQGFPMEFLEIASIESPTNSDVSAQKVPFFGFRNPAIADVQKSTVTFMTVDRSVSSLNDVGRGPGGNFHLLCDTYHPDFRDLWSPP